MSNTTLTRSHDVVVVGGGQAGLAIGYHLAKQGRDFTILEAASEPAAAWRERWNSLKLFTSARYDSLPGMAFPGDPDRYPTRDEVAAYLTDYAREFDLPVELGSRVRAVRRENDGYVIELDDRAYAARQVVIATGPFQTPFVPAIADNVADAVVQMHSTAYRSPESMPQGRVLVVGGGNTGFQIAQELSASHETHLSIGSRQTPLPQRILGRDLFWYLDATGLIQKTTESRIGRRMSGRDTLIGSTPRRLRKQYGVELHARAIDASGATIRFEDETETDVAGIVWATGFRVDHSWIDAPVFDDAGRLIHERGVTEAPGLYFLGIPFTFGFTSMLVAGAGRDAKHVVDRIAERASATRGAGTVERAPAAF